MNVRSTRWIRLVLAVSLLAAGCATGRDAVVQGGDFAFVSPGGQTRIVYDRRDRKRVREISGESVTAPGERISLRSYEGRVVVLNLWASWCAPCRTESHEFGKLTDEGAAKGFPVVGVDVRDDRSAASDFMTGFGVRYPSIYDPSSRIGLALPGIPLAAVPITLVIDRRQRVAAVFLGAVLASDVLPAINAVLAES
ncbi:TlpA disulfide reductase family protein [Amycolatopsis cynarae]|uniref:TlpA disulfide reductase family protein n=1 Tax=Amycolatopsis cynarae TaxID=2995223 RepID=A0ABY7BDH3_9PSEU|nr:TlpA disulfide reductase family protein [Amycolatopsis sp. HUAS 11-8]WAL69678.1 TlpA disulfide reductase family protein [Amycolatopsis sp. HUAS 11-8]